MGGLIFFRCRKHHHVAFRHLFFGASHASRRHKHVVISLLPAEACIEKHAHIVRIESAQLRIKSTQAVSGRRVFGRTVHRQQIGVAVFIRHTVTGIIKQYPGIAAVCLSHICYPIDQRPHIVESGILLHAYVFIGQTQHLSAICAESAPVTQGEIHLRVMLVILIRYDYGKRILGTQGRSRNVLVYVRSDYDRLVFFFLFRLGEIDVCIQHQVLAAVTVDPVAQSYVLRKFQPLQLIATRKSPVAYAQHAARHCHLTQGRMEKRIIAYGEYRLGNIHIINVSEIGKCGIAYADDCIVPPVKCHDIGNDKFTAYRLFQFARTIKRKFRIVHFIRVVNYGRRPVLLVQLHPELRAANGGEPLCICRQKAKCHEQQYQYLFIHIHNISS